MSNKHWLQQLTEPVVDPALEICDPHHHLWDFPGSRYLLDEFLDDIGGGHRIISTIFVECGSMYRAEGNEQLKPVGEVEFVNGVAAMSASGAYGDTRVAAGIVGFADLCLGAEVEETLRAQLQAGGRRFKGIRHATAWHPDPGVHNAHSEPTEHLMRDDAFRHGLEVLGELGLTFDAWIYHRQIPDFIQLAASVPGTTLVLDHFGGPLGVGPYKGRLDEVFDNWSEAIEPLSGCLNVYCKLGGINMKVNGYNWHKRQLPPSSDELVEATQRYYRRAIDVFGTDRCMFESNFPMDKESCSYTVLWNTFKKIAGDYDDAECRALLRGNAERCYKLAPSDCLESA